MGEVNFLVKDVMDYRKNCQLLKSTEEDGFSYCYGFPRECSVCKITKYCNDAKKALHIMQLGARGETIESVFESRLPAKVIHVGFEKRRLKGGND